MPLFEIPADYTLHVMDADGFTHEVYMPEAMSFQDAEAYVKSELSFMGRITTNDKY